MSKYTTQVRFICETMAEQEESKGYSSIDEIVLAAVPKIFDFDFDIWDADYKTVLCSKILKHYYTREICAETYGLWKLFLARKMQEIMPYYNSLYKSTVLEYNPLHDVDYQREYDRTGNETRDNSGTAERNSKESGTNSQTTKTDVVGWNLFNDTPQGSIDNIDSGDYLTTATKNTNDSTNTQNGSDNRTVNDNSNYHDNSDIDTTEKYIEKIVGKSAGKSYAKLVMEYRNTLINIDVMIINELSNLFMMVM